VQEEDCLGAEGQGGSTLTFFFDSEYFDLMFSARWLCLGCQGPSALSGLATWQVINQPAGIESNRHVHLEGIYQPMERGQKLSCEGRRQWHGQMKRTCK